MSRKRKLVGGLVIGTSVAIIGVCVGVSVYHVLTKKETLSTLIASLKTKISNKLDSVKSQSPTKLFTVGDSTAANAYTGTESEINDKITAFLTAIGVATADLTYSPYRFVIEVTGVVDATTTSTGNVEFQIQAYQDGLVQLTETLTVEGFSGDGN